MNRSFDGNRLETFDYIVFDVLTWGFFPRLWHFVPVSIVCLDVVETALASQRLKPWQVRFLCQQTGKLLHRAMDRAINRTLAVGNNETTV